MHGKSTGTGLVDVEIPAAGDGLTREQDRSPRVRTLGAFEQAYDAAVRDVMTDGQTKLDKEFKKLRQLIDAYGPKLLATLREVGGPAQATIQAEMQEATRITDAAAMERRILELKNKYDPAIRQAIRAAGLDIADLRRKVLAAVDTPKTPRAGEQRDLAGAGARLVGEELATADSIGGMWWEEPEPLPTPPPVPAFTEIKTRAPYPLFAREGQSASVTPDTGSSRCTAEIAIAMWSQSLASVGSTVDVPPDVRRVRVDAIVQVPDYYVGAWAVYTAVGYAALNLHLKLMDGANVVATSKFTVADTLAFILWFSQKSGSGRYPISLEFTQAPGVPRTFAGVVMLEAWAACGVVLNWAKASGGAKVESINYRLIR